MAETITPASLLENPNLSVTYDDVGNIKNTIAKITNLFTKSSRKLNGPHKEFWETDLGENFKMRVQQIKDKFKLRRVEVTDEQLRELLAEQGVDPKCIELCFAQEAGAEEIVQEKIAGVRTEAQDALDEEKPITAKSYLRDTYESLKRNGQDAHIPKYV